MVGFACTSMFFRLLMMAIGGGDGTGVPMRIIIQKEWQMCASLSYLCTNIDYGAT